MNAPARTCHPFLCALLVAALPAPLLLLADRTLTRPLPDEEAGEIAEETVAASDPGEPFHCDVSTWEGIWETNWGEMTLVFDRETELFHGTYGPSQHNVSGRFDPDHPTVLRGRWHHFGTASTGGFRFEMTHPGRFEGGWSWRVPLVGDGSGWNGTRKARDPSEDDGAEILAVPIGQASIVGPPSGPRNWSQRWLLKNTSPEAFWIYGYDANSPFVQIHSLSPSSGEWEHRGLGYCGTGASFHQIPAGGTFRVNVWIPDEIARRQLTVEFRRHSDADGDGGMTVRTRPLRLVPPTREPVPEAP